MRQLPFYKIAVSFSVVIGFFLNLFRSNNIPNARLNHPFASLLSWELALCSASIRAVPAHSHIHGTPALIAGAESSPRACRGTGKGNRGCTPPSDTAFPRVEGRQTQQKPREQRWELCLLPAAATRVCAGATCRTGNVPLFKGKLGPRWLQLLFVITPNCLRSA